MIRTSASDFQKAVNLAAILGREAAAEDQIEDHGDIAIASVTVTCGEDRLIIESLEGDRHRKLHCAYIVPAEVSEDLVGLRVTVDSVLVQVALSRIENDSSESLDIEYWTKQAMLENRPDIVVTAPNDSLMLLGRTGNQSTVGIEIEKRVPAADIPEIRMPFGSRLQIGRDTVLSMAEAAARRDDEIVVMPQEGLLAARSADGIIAASFTAVEDAEILADLDYVDRVATDDFSITRRQAYAACLSSLAFGSSLEKAEASRLRGVTLAVQKAAMAAAFELGHRDEHILAAARPVGERFLGEMLAARNHKAAKRLAVISEFLGEGPSEAVGVSVLLERVASENLGLSRSELSAMSRIDGAFTAEHLGVIDGACRAFIERHGVQGAIEVLSRDAAGSVGALVLDAKVREFYALAIDADPRDMGPYAYAQARLMCSYGKGDFTKALAATLDSVRMESETSPSLPDRWDAGLRDVDVNRVAVWASRVVEILRATEVTPGSHQEAIEFLMDQWTRSAVRDLRDVILAKDRDTLEAIGLGALAAADLKALPAEVIYTLALPTAANADIARLRRSSVRGASAAMFGYASVQADRSVRMCFSDDSGRLAFSVEDRSMHVTVDDALRSMGTSRDELIHLVNEEDLVHFVVGSADAVAVANLAASYGNPDRPDPRIGLVARYELGPDVVDWRSGITQEAMDAINAQRHDVSDGGMRIPRTSEYVEVPELGSLTLYALGPDDSASIQVPLQAAAVEQTLVEDLDSAIFTAALPISHLADYVGGASDEGGSLVFGFGKGGALRIRGRRGFVASIPGDWTILPPDLAPLAKALSAGGEDLDIETRVGLDDVRAIYRRMTEIGIATQPQTEIDTKTQVFRAWRTGETLDMFADLPFETDLDVDDVDVLVSEEETEREVLVGRKARQDWLTHAIQVDMFEGLFDVGTAKKNVVGRRRVS